MRGDSTRLRQVFINLAGNALKFTNEGQVAIFGRHAGATKDGLMLEFTVFDTGIGIPEEKRKIIFEAFAQADMSTARHYGGTGLGLSICERLVRLMGGRIWVESEVGRGSEFHFTMRVFWESAQEKLAVAKDQTLRPKMPQLLRRVLAVDNNSVNRELIERLLPRWSMSVVPAATAKDALALLAEARRTGAMFSAILIDMDMPSPGGFALLAAARASAAPDVPVILTHSRPLNAAERERCEQLTVTRFIVKPFRRFSLHEALRECHGEANAAEVSEAAKPVAKARASLRILLAEDNLVNQRLTSRLLEKMGHAVTIAFNGQLALRLLSEQEFDLVVMDMQMPMVDGLEATEKIRAGEKRSGKHLPIVAMTANAFEEDRQRCEQAGMDGYLSKPVTAKAIEIEIARVMALVGKDEKQEAPRRG